MADRRSKTGRLFFVPLAGVSTCVFFCAPGRTNAHKNGFRSVVLLFTEGERIIAGYIGSCG